MGVWGGGSLGWALTSLPLLPESGELGLLLSPPANGFQRDPAEECGLGRAVVAEARANSSPSSADSCGQAA